MLRKLKMLEKESSAALSIQLKLLQKFFIKKDLVNIFPKSFQSCFSISSD